ADITQDELPEGDVAIVRQVLQHLSNDMISKALENLTQYRYVIISESQPASDFTPNRDIPAGANHRIRIGSGIDLTAAPFNVPASQLKTLVSTTRGVNEYQLVTWVYEPDEKDLAAA